MTDTIASIKYKSGKCNHPDFEANVTVNRLEDSGRFMADVKIECSFCKQPFQFLGIPLGLNMNGATVDVGGTELRLAIKPADLTFLPEN